ncbi:MAG: cysteine-rich KTR domain-containing protein [Acutalibacteraceae bacterium]
MRDILLVSADDKLICPLCGRPTQQRVLPTSRLIDFPLYCKHCKSDSRKREYEPEPKPTC